MVMAELQSWRRFFGAPSRQGRAGFISRRLSISCVLEKAASHASEQAAADPCVLVCERREPKQPAPAMP